MQTTKLSGTSPQGSVEARFNCAGELITGRANFDDTSFNTLDLVDTAYNFWEPMVHQQFVITGILAFADKDVADNSDTIITIYETDSETNTTPLYDGIRFQFGMGKLTVLPLVPLNILVTEGAYLNAKTGDDDIHMTIIGHYVTAV